MKTLRFALGAALALTGCSMSVANESDGSARNQCSEDHDCAGAQGRCVNHICVATQGVISSLVFKVEAPGASNLDRFAGKTLLANAPNLPLGGGELELAVPGLAVVNGTITLPASRIDRLTNSDAPCTFDFTNFPLTITLAPRVTWPGLSVSPTTTTANALKCPCDSGSCDPCTPKFSVTVPAGDYDVYLEQKLGDPSTKDPACQIVPGAFPLTVQEGRMDVTLALPEPKALTLGVSWPGSVASVLDKWVVDMLDPVTGRRLSAQVVLGSQYAQIVASGSPPVYLATLQYLEDAANDGNETVRLAPPIGVDAPTVLVARLALGDGSVLNQLTVLPSPVQIEGSLLDGRPSGIGQGVPGTVTFVATEIDGIQPGTTASFQRSADFIDVASGSFQVNLLPGKYRVHALPAERCQSVACPDGVATCECPLGASELAWVVVDTPAIQAGKSVSLSARTKVVGSAQTPLGKAANGASARLDPQLVPVTPLQIALGEVPVTPRTAMSTVEQAGQFSLSADLAAFQFTLRPASSTGFPWFVRPDLVVDGSMAGSEQNLETLSLPLPVRYSGHVTVAGGTTVLPDVVIRAYAFLGKYGLTSGPDDPFDPAVSVIQVAETTADSSGKFDLLLPARIDFGSP